MRPSPKYNKIGIIFAMKGEAKPTINHYNLKVIKIIAGIEIYGNPENKIFVALNGQCPDYGVDNIGTNGAVLCTYIFCEEINPDIIINAGTAGGFKSRDGVIGDVYIGHDRVVFHDRRINLPKFDEYGIGNYTLIDTDSVAKAIGIKKGIVSTGNSLDYTDVDLEMMTRNNAVLKDMEAAAIAWVCKKLNKPFIPIKSITDLIDSEVSTEIEFQRNFEFATKNLNAKLIDLITLIHK